MKPQYLCDSYDHVKRTLLSGSPDGFVATSLMTESFTPPDLQSYRLLLGVDLPSEFIHAPKNTDRKSFFGAFAAKCADKNASGFLDPCTGIRLDEHGSKTKCDYVFLDEIAELCGSIPSRIVICYDQSFSRGAEASGRTEKLAAFKNASLHCAYYNASHVSFLVASAKSAPLEGWKKRMVAIGISNARIVT
jgi:hypothetical protein